MIEHRVGVDGLPVWVFPGALSPAECDVFVQTARWPRSPAANAYIEKQPDIAPRLGAILEPKLEELPLRITGWMKYVTYTRTCTPTAWHFDHPDGDADYKVYVYLNDAPGTLFCKEHPLRVPGRAGTIVCFDLDLEHTGEPHKDGELKLLVGLRPIVSAPLRR